MAVGPHLALRLPLQAACSSVCTPCCSSGCCLLLPGCLAVPRGKETILLLLCSGGTQVCTAQRLSVPVQQRAPSVASLGLRPQGEGFCPGLPRLWTLLCAPHGLSPACQLVWALGVGAGVGWTEAWLCLSSAAFLTDVFHLGLKFSLLLGPLEPTARKALLCHAVSHPSPNALVQWALFDGVGKVGEKLRKRRP